MNRKNPTQRPVEARSLKCLFEHEVNKIATIMKKRFEHYDTDPETKKHSGLISFKDMQKCLHSTSWITPKEYNFLLRDYAMKQGFEQINYTNFAKDLLQTRFELCDSRIMEMNLENIEQIVLDECARRSKDGKTILLRPLREALRESKQLVLTPFQIALLMGHSEPDRDARVDFVEFAKLVS
jgi:hypothetical protein